MKKLKNIFITTLLLISIFVLVSCDIPEVDDLSYLDQVMDLSQNSNLTGYTQEILTDDQEVVKTLVIDRENDIYKYTIEIKTYAPFGDESQFIETEDVEYYHNNQRYYLNDDIWQTDDQELKDTFFNFKFKNNYFSLFNIDEKRDSTVFTATLKNASVNTFFGESLNIKNVNLEMTYSSSNEILEFNLTYTDQNEEVTLKTIFNYEPHTLELPN